MLHSTVPDATKRKESAAAIAQLADTFKKNSDQQQVFIELIVHSDDTEHVEKALRTGFVPPDATSRAGVPALVAAACFGRTQFVELLLQKGADTTQQTPWGMSAEACATSFGYPTIVRMLKAAPKK